MLVPSSRIERKRPRILRPTTTEYNANQPSRTNVTKPFLEAMQYTIKTTPFTKVTMISPQPFQPRTILPSQLEQKEQNGSRLMCFVRVLCVPLLSRMEEEKKKKIPVV